MSKIPFEENYKEATPRGTIAWGQGKLKVPENVSVGGIEAHMKFFITAAALDADGMATNVQQALLDAVIVTFRSGLKTAEERTPIDTETLGQLLLDSWRLLERDAVGGVGVVAGLKAALAAGANVLECVIPVSLAHVEFFDEAGQVCGLGAPQLLDCDLTFKVDAEPLHALDANVTLTKVGIDLRAIEAEDAEGDREGITEEIREVKSNAENSITTPDGLVLSVEDTDDDLATSPIQIVTVTIRDRVVAADPATPADIQGAYERDPNTAAPENTLKTKRTPLYLVPKTPIAKLVPGPVTVKMRSHYKDLVTRVIYLPILSHAEVMARIARRALQLEDNEEIHAVVTAMVENCEGKFNPEQQPFLGWEYFTKNDPRFHTLPGIRCRKGSDKPYVRLPLKELVKAGTAYQLAVKDSAGAALGVVADWGRFLPGFIVSTKGLVEGGMSPVALDLRNQLASAPSQISARSAQKAA